MNLKSYIMKPIFLILTLITTISITAQNSEFKVYDNGLIYEETTMSKLVQIVDSLNLKYKNCELGRVFYSKCQTLGNVIHLDTGDIKAAKKDIEGGISFDLFMEKYPLASLDRNTPIVKYEYQNGENKYTEINAILSDQEIHQSQKAFAKLGDFTGKWIVDYSSGSSYSRESIEAFYFTSDFTSIPLSNKYARKIGYTNCLIDTTVLKFKETADYNNFDFPRNWQKLSTEEKENLLDTMRNTLVRGYCSMDNRPRMHAVNIALVSAETTNWEVFLRAHLDIMNDRFDRVSDGSYAWAARKTYLRELEELDINVIDLIIGISLRIENPVKNHYYGSIGRLGRALSESQQKDEFIAEMSRIIEDKELDYYNRIITYWLFKSMINWTEDEELQKQYRKALAATFNSFSLDIQSQLDVE